MQLRTHLELRYLDGIGGIFTSSLGHQYKPVVDALRGQLDEMCFAPPLHSISAVTLDFVEKLGSVAPGDLSFVKPFCSASEAMECAIKWSRFGLLSSLAGRQFRFESANAVVYTSSY